jgi:hypothetical protein
MLKAVALALALAGCSFKEPPPLSDSGGGEQCTDSDGTCVCLNGTCVTCTPEDERNCRGTTPQCGSDNLCHACRANDDCPAASACLEDGACADPTRVIAASPAGVGTSPCGAPGQSACSIEQALVELSPLRDTIRLAPGNYSVGGADGLDFSNASATLVARGATITKAGANGPVISVRNGNTLIFIGGTVQGPNNATDGIRCTGNARLRVHEATIERMPETGIESNACELTVSRSRIRENLVGGINMTNNPRIASITNNFIFHNGNPTGGVGGMALRLAAGSKVEFNTVVDNGVAPSGGLAGGILCESAEGYEPEGNIVYRNVGGLDGLVQVIGSCVFLSGKGFAVRANGPTENVPGFENPNALNPSFRLTPNSPATVRDVFDCRDAIDFEGDPRPSNGKCDYGADELRAGAQ